MTGVYLRFYVHEFRRHHGVLLYEWLLERAREMGIHGGSAFRAIAGYGRHGVMHEAHFFELAADLPVVVEFLVTDEEAEQLFALLKRERLQVFFQRTPAEFGVTGDG